MISVFWSMIGVPVGIVIALLKLLKLEGLKNLRWKKILLFCFGGVGLLIGAFIIFFIINVIAGMFGFQASTLSLPRVQP